jgi:ethanolamine utilization cobalamin adenosyltransferase
MEKNEGATLLYGKETVEKDDPQIMLRGEIDSLYARAVYTCAFVKQYGRVQVTGGMEDIVRVVRELMRAEATCQRPEVGGILGMDLDEVRHVSHHVNAELGLEPYMPDENTDEATALLNLLRTEIRRAERAAVYAGGDNPANEQIQLVLNRLSSAAYILMLESRAERIGG